MKQSKDILLDKLRSGAEMSRQERFQLTMLLSFPAILAQLSMCLMSCIDASMVGHLGSNQAAAIGLVSTTTWIFGSFCYGNSSGFSVQIAHRCGAGDFDGAKKIFLQGLATTLCYSAILAIAGICISRQLPAWLGGAPEIQKDASAYFLTYAIFLPLFQLAILSEASLIASGNMKVPSITSIAMCIMDVAFNYLFIYVAGLGVLGAALGTGLATACSGLYLTWFVFFRSNELNFRHKTVSQRHEAKAIARQAVNISWPLWLQNLITRGAFIMATVLIAPLGTVAIAANSFAIIAEGFCYLPGAGVQDAASTLIGQSLGAGRKDLARKFSTITIASGSGMMAVLAIFMYALAPQIMGILSQDTAVIELGARCLRIEAWAELLYGVSIVAHGCCIGAGDTLVPSCISLLSMWVIRIGLALMLIPKFGLVGYWYAMAIELSFKGIIFAIRIHGNRWMKTRLTNAEDKG